jgi:hypothetical protein
MDAFVVPGGFGTRQEMHNRTLHRFVENLPDSLSPWRACAPAASMCTGSWAYAAMRLLDGLPATSRKEPDRLEASALGMVPLERLACLAPACRVSRARVVDAGRIVTAGGISAGMELGFHLLRRAASAVDGSWATRDVVVPCGIPNAPCALRARPLEVTPLPTARRTRRSRVLTRRPLPVSVPQRHRRASKPWRHGERSHE